LAIFAAGRDDADVDGGIDNVVDLVVDLVVVDYINTVGIN
jgi:hypothetical protein